MHTDTHTLEVAPGCRASAIIYQNAQVYGDYQLIITINASTRQLTVQPNATSNIHIHTHTHTHTCRDLVNYLSGAGPITVLTEPHTLKIEIY